MGYLRGTDRTELCMEDSNKCNLNVKLINQYFFFVFISCNIYPLTQKYVSVARDFNRLKERFPKKFKNVRLSILSSVKAEMLQITSGGINTLRVNFPTWLPNKKDLYLPKKSCVLCSKSIVPVK